VAFDETLAQRVRAHLDARPDVDERRMFGGVAFLVAGNLCAGVYGDELIARVGNESAAELLATEAGVRPCDITGRPMRAWVLVSPEAIAEEQDLERWLRRAEAFASSLPPK
jgi:TfoX/Sxy family transcriptional regulator of competence genes